MINLKDFAKHTKDTSSFIDVEIKRTSDLEMRESTEDEVDVDTPEPPKKEQVEIPDYMINSPEFLGYKSEEQQRDIYRYALSGFEELFNELDTVKILDVGAGVGDLYKELPFEKVNIKYKGIDSNPLLSIASKKKFGGDGPEIISKTIGSFASESLTSYNLIFNILTTSTRYPDSKDTPIEEFEYQVHLAKQLTEDNDGEQHFAVFICTTYETGDGWVLEPHEAIKLLDSMALNYNVDRISSDIENIYRIIIRL